MLILTSVHCPFYIKKKINRKISPQKWDVVSIIVSSALQIFLCVWHRASEKFVLEFLVSEILVFNEFVTSRTLADTYVCYLITLRSTL